MAKLDESLAYCGAGDGRRACRGERWGDRNGVGF